MFLAVAILVFLAARYIWSARTATAAIWAVAAGALAWWIGGMKPATWQNATADATPNVGF
jgi:Na+/H+ antiporter NhaD/arsenite permease-like protein